MSTLSTCLIVRDEADNIERCISSIQPFSDEIIVYDTGSIDGTQDICRKMDKVTVIQGEWRDDFAWARNQSYSYAKCDFILWVDADDYIDEKTREWLKQYKEHDMYGFDMTYLIYKYDARENESDGNLHFPRERILRRSMNPVWHSRIHEYVKFPEGVEYSTNYVSGNDAYILHFKGPFDPKRNLRIFQDMESKGEIHSGRDWDYYGTECKNNSMFEKALECFNNAVNDANIWEIDRLGVFVNMSLIYLDTNMRDNMKALECALRAVACLPTPRADACCMAGRAYLELGQNQLAKEWFLKAYGNVPDVIAGSLMDAEYYKIIPLINLCVCEWRLGNIIAAKRYNEMVLELEPENEAALGNKTFFENV